MISLYQGESPLLSSSASMLILSSLSIGGAIMLASLVLFESEFLNIVSISFTALVLNELIMVAVEITTWHMLMIVSEVFTLALYVISIAFLPEYFGQLPSLSSLTPADSISLRRPQLCPFSTFHLESRPHRRYIGCTSLDHQMAQRQVCANSVRKAEGLLECCMTIGSVPRLCKMLSFPQVHFQTPSRSLLDSSGSNGCSR